MYSLSETIDDLCKKRGITGYRLCKDIGVSPNLMTELRSGRRNGLSAKTADKIASYFGISVSQLLGTDTKKAPTQKGERVISDKELMFALWGDSQNVDAADLEDVRRYAAFVEERKKKK